MSERLTAVGTGVGLLVLYIAAGVLFFLPGNDSGAVHITVAVFYWVFGWMPAVWSTFYLAGAFDV